MTVKEFLILSDVASNAAELLEQIGLNRTLSQVSEFRRL